MSRVGARIAPATPHTNGLSALLRLATYTSVDQGLGTSVDYRAIQGVTGTLGCGTRIQGQRIWWGNWVDINLVCSSI